MALVEHNQAVRERYDGLAQQYDQRWAAYIGSSVRHTVARLNVSPGETVLDVGCGTGALGRQLGDAVVGIDLSERMLAQAPGARVAGDALTLPFGAETFDVVASISVLHYWVEPVQVLREIRRVMRVGGRLVLTDWCDDYLACRICDRALRLWHAGGYVRAYGSRELGRLIESAGYATVAVEKYKIGWLWGLMTATATA
ncbi:MAG TPA: methyltransferase domain-containing protein [Gemmatimonadaceae bacterium]|nr:methyltransferase domain-containing protein [Gemmatimonadaceae bacterium]